MSRAAAKASRDASLRTPGRTRGLVRVSPRSRSSDSAAQLEAIARAIELDQRERAERAQLEATRQELYAAVADALDQHGVPVRRLAGELDRDRPALYRWRDATRRRRSELNEKREPSA
jgi:hypothetical protein